MNKTVINLTNLSLSKEQLYIFYLSQSFAPTPNLPNQVVFENDMNNWANKLRWKYYYEMKVVNTNEKVDEKVKRMEVALIKNKKIQPATKSKSATLEFFIHQIQQDVQKHASKRKYTIPDNLDNNTRNAWNKLKKTL